MKKLAFVLALLLASEAAGAQTPKYPPLSEFMMPQEAEIALARSAAPDNVSSRATIKIFTKSGFKVAVEGDNGFVCIVLRGGRRRPTGQRSSATMFTLLTSERPSASTRSRLEP